MDWQLLAGVVLQGAIFGGGACLGGVWLYGQIDADRRWSRAHDAISKAVIYLLAVGTAAGLGAVAGAEASSLTATAGALWGLAGGVLGCAGLFGRVQAAAAALVDRKGGKL